MDGRVMSTQPTEASSPKLVNSVLSALRVLEAVSRLQPVGVTEVARAVGLTKSSAQRLLLTLEQAGWTRRTTDPTTRWMVTTRSFTVGGRAVQRYGLLDAARPLMQRLSAVTQETIHLVMLEEAGLISVERIQSPRAVPIPQPLGGWAPLHATSPGKAILSALTDSEVDRLLPEPLYRYTPLTITDRQELALQLVEVRHQGYAIDSGEWRSGVAGSGAPIQIAPGKPIAGLSISAPLTRMPTDRLHELGELVAETAREISRSLGRTEL